MRHLILTTALLALGFSAWADNKAMANFECERQSATDAYRINGSVTFVEEFQFYGPAMNKFLGHVNFAFADGTNNSVVYAQTSGTHIRSTQFRGHDYWTFMANSQTGETLLLSLDQPDNTQTFAYGEVTRGNGKTYTTKCQINLLMPSSGNAPFPGRGH